MNSPLLPHRAPRFISSKSRRGGHQAALALLLGFALAQATPAIAQVTRVWTGAADNEQGSDPSNWSPYGRPERQDVVITPADLRPSAAKRGVYLDVNCDVRSWNHGAGLLTVDSVLTLDTLVLTANSALELNAADAIRGAVRAEGNAQLILNGTINGPLTLGPGTVLEGSHFVVTGPVALDGRYVVTMAGVERSGERQADQSIVLPILSGSSSVTGAFREVIVQWLPSNYEVTQEKGVLPGSSYPGQQSVRLRLVPRPGTRAWTGVAGTASGYDPTNWSPNGRPQRQDNVVTPPDLHPAAKTRGIHLEVNTEMRSWNHSAGLLTVDSVLTLDTLILAADGGLELSAGDEIRGAVRAEGTGQLTLNGTINGPLTLGPGSVLAGSHFLVTGPVVLDGTYSTTMAALEGGERQADQSIVLNILSGSSSVTGAFRQLNVTGLSSLYEVTQGKGPFPGATNPNGQSVWLRAIPRLNKALQSATQAGVANPEVIGRKQGLPSPEPVPAAVPPGVGGITAVGTTLPPRPAVVGEPQLRPSPAARDKTGRKLAAPSSEATLDSPDTVKAGDFLTVSFTGPIKNLDYLVLAKPDAGARTQEWVSYKNAYAGSPTYLNAPKDPGDYELRYMDQETGRTLARKKIVVVP